MLLQFVVSNYRSFKKETIINMAPAKSRVHHDHVISDRHGKNTEALSIAALYGANASGKSNLIKAIAFARDLIVTGTRADSSIPVTPFRLSPKSSLAPSHFEFIFKHEGVLYTYGFIVSSQLVHEEWLFAVYNRQEVRLFERTTEGGKARVEQGNKLASNRFEKERIRFVAEGTRPNQLFLTEAHERNVSAIQPVMQWFSRNVAVITPDTRFDVTLKAYSDKTFTSYLERILRNSDTGIHGITTKAEPLDFDRQIPDMPDDVRRSILSDLQKPEVKSMLVTDGRRFFTFARAKGNPIVVSLRTQHKSADIAVEFDTEDESDGTQRMMHLAPILLDAQRKESEKVFFIDELDRSMHPLLCRFVVETFLKGVSETESKSQLIFTTHEASLLEPDLLRRDEVWFVEKGGEGDSTLSSLAEYEVRSDLRISKGYLDGRFGAIPLLGDSPVLEKK